MMREVIAKITRTNGFEQIDTSDSSVDAFRSPRFKDVVIVAEYTTEDLYSFETCVQSIKVMDTFDVICKSHPDALKNTSLIICHKVIDIDERDSAKNIVLKIEENSYGLRKYIVSYSDESILAIKQLPEETIVADLHSKLQLGFENFIDTKSDSQITEYDAVLQLFIKLPFMKMESSRSANDLPPLSNFLNNKLKEHAKLISYISDEGESNVRDGLNVDFDSEIDAILADSRIVEVLEPTEGDN